VRAGALANHGLRPDPSAESGHDRGDPTPASRTTCQESLGGPLATKKKRRIYTREFKAEAIKLAQEQGLTRAQASRDLGVAESVLGRWVQLAERDAQPGAVTTEEREELRRLRKENQALRMEREIPRRAAAFSARESR
jgi:transposase